MADTKCSSCGAIVGAKHARLDVELPGITQPRTFFVCDGLCAYKLGMMHGLELVKAFDGEASPT